MDGWIDEWIDTKNSDLNDSLFNLKIKMMYFSKKLKMATNNIWLSNLNLNFDKKCTIHNNWKGLIYV